MRFLLHALLVMTLGFAPVAKAEPVPMITVTGAIASVRLHYEHSLYDVYAVDIRLTIHNDDSVALILPKVRVRASAYRLARDLAGLSSAEPTQVTDWQPLFEVVDEVVQTPDDLERDYVLVQPGCSTALFAYVDVRVNTSDAADVKYMTIDGVSWYYPRTEANRLASQWHNVGVLWTGLLQSEPFDIDLNTARKVVHCNEPPN